MSRGRTSSRNTYPFDCVLVSRTSPLYTSVGFTLEAVVVRPPPKHTLFLTSFFGADSLSPPTHTHTYPQQVVMHGSEPSTVPPYRSFLSLELPFTVTPTASTAITKAQQEAVESFAPATFLFPCLAAEVPPTKFKHDMAPSSGSDDGGEETVGGPTMFSNPKTGLVTGDPAAYCASPIFSGWRSLGCDHNLTDSTSTTTTAVGSKHANVEPHHMEDSATLREENRRGIFPSIEPQVLLQGFYRNDLLVRVTTRTTRRRCTHAGTTEADAGASDTPPRAVPRVEVVGVVSRAVEISRPADFTFSLFTKEQLAAHPHLCSADVFPPSHYLHEKTPFEVNYLMGRQANGSVAQHHQTAEPLTTVEPLPTAATVLTRGVTSGMPSILVSPDDPHLPPSSTPFHAAYLAGLGCVTADGSSEQDPVEVRVIANLLARRPVWMMRDLTEAIMASGLCPRSYFNKQVVQCLSYAMTNGPFQRLRIRLGYNPYASSSSVIYQRLSVRISRRSVLGMQLRDLSRSHHITEVTQQIRQCHGEAVAKRRAGRDCCMTLLELLCRTVAGGFLWSEFQLADMADDDVYQALIANTMPGEDMPLSQRPAQRGWLSETAHTRGSSRFVDALTTFIEDEVLPLLRALNAAPGGAEEVAGGDVSDVSDADADSSSNFSVDGDASESSGVFSDTT